MRWAIPLLIGVLGCAVLLSLGKWQTDRLLEKREILREIDLRVGAEPVSLPQTPVVEKDAFLSVAFDGTGTGDRLRVLVSSPATGPAYRVIERFAVNDRYILLDRGIVPVTEIGRVAVFSGRVEGNVHWPDERNRFTPAPDDDLWFARDVAAMARYLETDPTMVVARKTHPDQLHILPSPLNSAGISNNHLNYAITWFGLAAVWAAMTGLWIWRIARGKED